jgi:hypothetical protein
MPTRRMRLEWCVVWNYKAHMGLLYMFLQEHITVMPMPMLIVIEIIEIIEIEIMRGVITIQ